MSLLVRERHESALVYVKRSFWADGTVSAYELAHDVKRVDGVPAVISPVELDHVIAKLRADWWVIQTVERDASGYATYRLQSAPEKKKRERQDYSAEQRAEAAKWVCAECGERAITPPKVLLGGLAQGRCTRCKKKVYFRLRLTKPETY